MAEITERTARDMHRQTMPIGSGTYRHYIAHYPLTMHEQNQLAHAWLCLNMLREMAASGERQGVIDCLTDPARMNAEVYPSETREGGRE